MPPATSSADRSFEFREGQTLAGCYLLRRRAEGTGQRVVWLAQDEVLGKEVSLHFLPAPVLEDAEALAVLRHEVKRTRQLIHPSILRVYDFVQEEDWAAIAMDAFSGRTLDAALTERPAHFFDVADVRSWLATLCHTLDDAHRIQLVHGDLSPANVIIEEDGRARIANFGLSICIKHALGELENDDAADAPPIGHQSPQQLEGKAPTAADDIYGLGVLIHRLLVGAFPFEPTAEGRAPAGIAAHRARLGKKGAPVPSSWEKIVTVCLDRDPGTRPRSASEIIRRLGLDRAEPEAGTAAPAENVSPAVPAGSGAALASEAAVARTEPEAASANIIETRSSPEAKAESERPVEPRPTESVEPLKDKETKQESIGGSDLDARPRDVEGRSGTAADIRPATRERSKRSKPQPLRSPDTFVSRQGKRSRVPAIALAAVAAAVVIALIIFFSTDRKENVAQINAAGAAAEEGNTTAPTVPTVTTTAIAPAGGEAPLSTEPREPVRQGTEPGTTLPIAGTRDPAPPLPPVAAVQPPPPTPPAPSADPAVASRMTAVTEARKALEISDRALQTAQEHKQAADQAVADLKTKIETSARALAPVEKAAGEMVARRKAREEELRASEQAARHAEQNAAEKVRLAEEGRKSLEGVDASLNALKTMVDASGKPFAPIKKATDEMVALRKKRETDVRTAETGAQQARTAAEEKARRVEQAREALADTEAQGGEQLEARDRAAAELKELQIGLDEKQRLATEAATALEVAVRDRARLAATLEQSEQAIADARAADEKSQAEKIAAESMVAENARKAREAEAQKLADARREAEMQKVAETQKARELEKQRLEKELADELSRIKQAFSERLAKVDQALADSGTPEAKSPVPEPKAVPAAVPNAVAPTVAPVEPKPPAAETIPAEPKTVPPETVPVRAEPPLPVAEPKAEAPTELAKLETKPLVPPPAADPASSTGGAAPGYVNSLGMKFAPVGDILFCIWQTRVKDFDAFAKGTGLKSLDWKDPGFKQGSDHPVVRVTWQEATLFCKWLTTRERKDGRLAPNQEYRLPTDLEWSRAVGLPEETGKTPESRDMSVPDVYPWGTQWPPPPGAGNYTGEETGSDVAIRGYNDGFPWTSPVGQFPANQFGLFDMGGNVWQWCQDTWSNESKAKVLRGASWYNGALKLSLLSSCRVHAAPDGSTDNYGFRVVIGRAEGEKSARK